MGEIRFAGGGGGGGGSGDCRWLRLSYHEDRCSAQIECPFGQVGVFPGGRHWDGKGEFLRIGGGGGGVEEG